MQKIHFNTWQYINLFMFPPNRPKHKNCEWNMQNNHNVQYGSFRFTGESLCKIQPFTTRAFGSKSDWRRWPYFSVTSKQSEFLSWLLKAFKRSEDEIRLRGETNPDHREIQCADCRRKHQRSESATDWNKKQWPWPDNPCVCVAGGCSSPPFVWPVSPLKRPILDWFSPPADL